MRNGATQPVAVSRSTWYGHARFRESTQPPPLEPFLAQQDTLLNRSSTDQVQKSPPGSRPSSRSPPNKRRIRDSEGTISAPLPHNFDNYCVLFQKMAMTLVAEAVVSVQLNNQYQRT
ncbi:hypothetical protein BDZ97DRAFT_1863764 [Flammula alnicola]|nr:hypothetical protein BDZ97DRAFT_1863764 [Flammula alnicola]